MAKTISKDMFFPFFYHPSKFPILKRYRTNQHIETYNGLKLSLFDYMFKRDRFFEYSSSQVIIC